MILEDLILTRQSNNFQTEQFDIPFIHIVQLNANYISVIKEFLMNYDDNQWLKDANETILKKLMATKLN